MAWVCPRSISRSVAGGAAGARHPRSDPRATRPSRIRSQRREPGPGHVLRAGRHHRGASRLRRDRRAHRAVRRRRRAHHRVRSAHRRKVRRPRRARHLPGPHYVTSDERLQKAIARIEAELQERLAWFETRGQAARGPAAAHAHAVRPRDDARGRLLQRHRELLGAHRRPRTGRGAVHAARLFPRDFLLVIDESHVTMPQLHGQYEGDRSRKETLVDHGFRLPSAADNRPLRFDEFYERVSQVRVPVRHASAPTSSR